jgi:hypothetical protein
MFIPSFFTGTLCNWLDNCVCPWEYFAYLKEEISLTAASFIEQIS